MCGGCQAVLVWGQPPTLPMTGLTYTLVMGEWGNIHVWPEALQCQVHIMAQTNHEPHEHALPDKPVHHIAFDDGCEVEFRWMVWELRQVNDTMRERLSLRRRK